MSTHGPPLPWLFPAGLGLALVLGALPGESPLTAALVLGVLLLGLPHGGFDPALARQCLRLRGPLAWTAFLAAYTSVAAMVVAAWWQWPQPALAAFLAYSAWHFGADTGGRLDAAGALGYGVWVVFLPLALQPEATGTVLALLTGRAPEALLAAARPACLVAALLLLGGLLRSRTAAATDWRDPLLLLGAAWLLPPLAYFIAYFCFLHSPRHLLATAQRLGLASWRDRLRALAPATLGSWLLAAAALPWVLGASPRQAIVQLVFIGLAALTVPHMLLGALSGPQPEPPGRPSRRPRARLRAPR